MRIRTPLLLLLVGLCVGCDESPMSDVTDPGVMTVIEGDSIADEPNAEPNAETNAMATEPEPVVAAAVTDEPATKESATEESAAEESAAEESATEESATEETPAETAPIEEPVVEQSVGDEPGIDEPAAENPPKEDKAMSEKEGKEFSQKVIEADEYNDLNSKEQYVLLQKGTERAGIGEYTDNKAKGIYICRRCNAALYKSDSKFDSHCGWPSFDDEIPGRVERLPDADGLRTEIICKNCGGHLGHVFFGEGFTAKDTRHCVNSISMRFIAEGKELPAMIKKKVEKKSGN